MTTVANRYTCQTCGRETDQLHESRGFETFDAKRRIGGAHVCCECFAVREGMRNRVENLLLQHQIDTIHVRGRAIGAPVYWGLNILLIGVLIWLLWR
jgi:hypothetical protein